MKKKLIAIIPVFIMMMSLCVICAFAGNTSASLSLSEDYGIREGQKVFDGGDMLSDSEEEALNKKLDALSKKMDMDVVVFTMPSLGEYATVQALADDLYDYCGYKENGVYMLVTDGTPGQTDVHVGGAGKKGCKIFNDKKVNKIIDATIPELKNQDFAGAFNTFATQVEKTYKASKFAPPIFLLISPIVGLIAGFVYAGSLKSKLDSVKMAANANDYIRQGSFNLTGQRDTFLYNSIQRTHIERSGGGGGGTHTGSSGASHTGASRHI